MKKIFVVILALVLLAGCGGKAEKVSGNDTAAADTSVNALITDEEVKALLVGKQISVRYKDNSSSDKVIEREEEKKFVISEITGLDYTTKVIQEGEGRGTFIDIEGTFQAFGSPYKGDPSFYETAEPAKFGMSVHIKDGVPSSQTFDAQAPLIKPAKPIDLDNLLEIYISRDACDDIYYDPDPEDPDNRLLAVVDDHKPVSENIKFVVVEDPFGDDGLMERILSVEIYDGKDYLCTGRMTLDYVLGDISIITYEFEKLR